MEEKNAEVLIDLFASVFSSKISCSLGTQSPELEELRQHNETPIIQEEMVSNLLHHLDTHKAVGPHKGTEVTGGRVHQVTFHHVSAVLGIQKGPI